MDTTTAQRSTLESELRARVRGEVIGRDHAEYDRARAVWNGLVDRHPSLIVRCVDTDDVVACVEAAARHRPPVSIRGGGHQVAGSAVCDDGLVIDLSRMRGVRVDPVARLARVQGGALWQDVDAATQVHGLATPGGEVSETGVAGLTLGGGLGLLQRAFGLACDNVVSMEVVTADGVVRTASAIENPDLFWTLRGAGRGVGVVTEFTFALHPVGPDVATAGFAFEAEDAASVFAAWREVALAAPESVAPEFALWSLPPFAGLPEEFVGRSVALAFGTFIGDPDDATPVLESFSRLGDPLLDLSGTSTWVETQSAYDPTLPAGARYYWKSHFVDDIDPATIATLAEHASRRPDARCAVIVRTLGGAIDRVGPDGTAYAHRGARFNVSIDGIWTDPALDEACIGWVRGLWSALEPVSRGVYLNFAGFGEDGVRDRVLGRNARRVDRIRRAYDPDGLFDEAARQP
ncbi:FAD-binding oxidoreductase [Microbacterium sp. NPDC056569]|uniref:FAD-binding oxidoreductase n=1 Tax=Microbacterium sp. NPDC056569 TaxID=3345867 RepID=UPI00366FF192